ncbi:putative RING-H2 finger protein ATL53 [Punica granatum]|uniref:RING-type E3 ubiquitin transferase n=2 Tax=Punica granatum TaxID=22663 RepID=A0A218XVX5_PUNGR|nr:putative RING-H2 finger protein ATL53 [Punica granatum]OWM89325.1 hypothetical protein CDL15_Pgr024070 [Punica granatum]PKI61673.1 hypothetical protein CRG98_017897 [Punica granatum]
MYMVPSPASATGEAQPSFWSPAVISLVASVGTVFLLFCYYTIIRKICSELGIGTLRNQAQRHLLNEANPDDPSLQFHSRGLDDSTVQSLPIIRFLKDEKEKYSILKNTDCAVCLGEFEDGEQLKFLPKCSHSFHVSCINMWFMSHSNCPLCRTHVFELSMSDECSVSMDSLLETLRREDLVQERTAHYQNLQSEILRNHAAETG